jgi:putative FmdB family regulatory protein
MPNYGFICDNCKHTFDRYLSMNDREQPLSEACEKCSENKIVRDYTNFSQPIATDTNYTPDKKTGGQWSQLMNKIKKGVAKRHHHKLDRATDRSGHKWH